MSAMLLIPADAFAVNTKHNVCSSSVHPPVHAPSMELRCSTSTSSTPVHEFANMGLLRGIAANDSKFYTTELPMDSYADVEWLGERGLPYEAAKLDAAERNITVDDYLATVNGALLKFLTSGEVHDREEFYGFLEEALVTTPVGQLLLVLGGKSVGKSLVLSDFEKRLKKENSTFLPLLLDARQSPRSSFATLILENYEQLFKQRVWPFTISEKDALKGLFEILKRFRIPVKDDMLDSVEQFFGFLLTQRENITSSQALESFVVHAESLLRHPVLIVDEANLVLGRDDGIGEDASSDTLNTIVRLTKQSNRLTVILASSEYGYPYKLEGKEKSFNLNDIRSMLFAGEIPPCSMWDLLVRKTTMDDKANVIGMGENLASVLITSYGGHLLRLSSAFWRLKSKKENFSVADELNQITEGMYECFRKYPTRTLWFLRQLAKSGFVLVSEARDPAVEMIVKQNLGGIVSRERSTIVGQPESVWCGEETYGLVPTSESARLVMARFVVYKERERKREEERRRGWRRLLFWRKKI
jgi:archaellum biogenesis ATPase FlaH